MPEEALAVMSFAAVCHRLPGIGEPPAGVGDLLPGLLDPLLGVTRLRDRLASIVTGVGELVLVLARGRGRMLEALGGSVGVLSGDHAQPRVGHAGHPLPGGQLARRGPQPAGGAAQVGCDARKAAGEVLDSGGIPGRHRDAQGLVLHYESPCSGIAPLSAVW